MFMDSETGSTLVLSLGHCSCIPSYSPALFFNLLGPVDLGWIFFFSFEIISLKGRIPNATFFIILLPEVAYSVFNFRRLAFSISEDQGLYSFPFGKNKTKFHLLVCLEGC